LHGFQWAKVVPEVLDNLKVDVLFDLMGDQPGCDSQTGNDPLRVKRLFRLLTPF